MPARLAATWQLVVFGNDSDVVIDINGYFAPLSAGGLSLHTLMPCQFLDTRVVGGQFVGTRTTNVNTDGCSVPSTAQAFVLNATVVPPNGLGFLTLWPNQEAKPFVSTLNSDSSIASNMVVVPTLNGAVNAYASDPTQLILDISAYFAL